MKFTIFRRIVIPSLLRRWNRFGIIYRFWLGQLRRQRRSILSLDDLFQAGDTANERKRIEAESVVGAMNCNIAAQLLQAGPQLKRGAEEELRTGLGEVLLVQEGIDAREAL